MRAAMGIVLGFALAGTAAAQAPDDALSASWTAICAGAAPGSALADRCSEIFAGGPGSSGLAAAGNFLGEIPGQGRAATRDGAPDDGELRTSLAAGWSVFLGADAGRLTRRGGDNEAPFDGDTGTLTAGVDWMPADDWQLGLLLTHARDELDFTRSAGSLETRFTGAVAVAGWRPHAAWSIDAYAGRLDGDYRIRRAIAYRLPDGTQVASLASASPSADRDLAGLGATWSHAAGPWEWQLGAGIDWQSTAIASYSETGGAGLAVAVPGRGIVSRRGRIDATLSRTFSAAWGVWQPLASLGWRHEYANPARPLTVRFLQDAGGAPVVFDTDDPDAAWGEAALGASFVFAGGHSAFVEWRQRFGHDFLRERVLAVGWRIELP